MAVTTTYSLDLVQNIYLPLAPAPASEPSAAGLANGGFMVSGTHAGHTDLDIFHANLGLRAEEWNITGTAAAIGELANGNLVVVSQDADSILYSIRDAFGGAVVASTDIGDANSLGADVAALTGGNFVVVNQDTFGEDPNRRNDIDVRVLNSAGGLISSFAIGALAAPDMNAAVTALDDGSFAVAWHSQFNGNTAIWYALYNSNGAVRKAPAVFDQTGSVNRNVDIAAKSGGFVLVYEDNGWGTGSDDISLVEFNLSGVFESSLNFSRTLLPNPDWIIDGSNDANPVLSRIAPNLLAVGFEKNVFSDTDTIVALYDSNANSVIASRNVVGGENVADDTGGLAIAGSAHNRINVVHSNLTDGGLDGETLVIRRRSIGDADANNIAGTDNPYIADYIDGQDGDDALYGNGGEDTLIGGESDDQLFGNDGDDILIGGNGADVLAGGPGDDVINGVDGQPGDTASYADATGGVTVSLATTQIQAVGGGLGTDRLFNIDTLVGSQFDDTLTCRVGAFSVLSGGGGIDLLRTDSGYGGIVNGGAGTDTIDFSTSQVAVTCAVSAGGDGSVGRVHGQSTTFTYFTGIENVTGGAAADYLTGNGGVNVLNGLGGRDILFGGPDNDTLRGGDEVGLGDISLSGDGGSDRVFGGWGDDRIYGGADGDTLLSGEAGNDVIAAGEDADTADGGDGDDIVYGEGGRDTLRGGRGNDTIYGGEEVGTGDMLVGEGGIDWISGGGGGDRIDGGTGNDRYLGGDAGDDLITGGLGEDRQEGGAGNDLLYGQDDNDTLVGGENDDSCFGGVGNDNLYGNAGNDFLQADEQNDNIRGGAGFDSFKFDPGNGSDAIFDFANDQDTLLIDPRFGFANAAAVLAASFQTANHVRIILGAGNQIYLWDYLAPGSGNSIGNLIDDIVIA